jgi:hypothetical protein
MVEWLNTRIVIQEETFWQIPISFLLNNQHCLVNRLARTK